MNTQDPLAQLRDIHLPDPISWWPPAPGWWLLALLILAAVFYSLRWLIRRRAHNCYRGEALHSLMQLQISLADEHLTHCREILTLLRRTAKTAYPHLSLASELTPSMLSQLNQCCSSPVFNQVLQQQLGELPYQANPTIPESLIQQLHDATKLWLKKHRRVISC